jgi:hypothetical protein
LPAGGDEHQLADIHIPGLVPGHLYAYRSRKFGGATTFSDWCDVLEQCAA